MHTKPSENLYWLCVATRATLSAIVHQRCNGQWKTETPAQKSIEEIAKFHTLTLVADQAIMAMKGLYDHVPPDHVIPLSEVLGRLEPDGVCGDTCKRAGELIDNMIDHEKPEDA